jgi:carboxypeptidase C (cathepsin A)
MGKVENNLIEIETALENKLEKVLYVLQDAVFIVSTKGLSPEVKQTSVYVYAKDMKEITPAMSLDELSKEYEQKNAELEVETEKLVGQTSEAIRLLINAKMLLLKEDVQFLEKAIQVAKDLKK